MYWVLCGVVCASGNNKYLNFPVLGPELYLLRVLVFQLLLLSSRSAQKKSYSELPDFTMFGLGDNVINYEYCTSYALHCLRWFVYGSGSLVKGLTVNMS